MNKKSNKRGIIPDYIGWLLFALAVLVVLGIFAALLKVQGVSLIDRLMGVITGR
jgi:hypothetical protein